MCYQEGQYSCPWWTMWLYYFSCSHPVGGARSIMFCDGRSLCACLCVQWGMQRHAASGLPSTSSYWPCHVNETTFRCNYFSVKLVCSCTYYCSCCSQKLSLTKPFEVENLYILDVEQVTKGVLFLWHLQLFSALIRQILSLVRLIKIGDVYQPSSCKKILKSLVACWWNCTGKCSGAALMMSV